MKLGKLIYGCISLLSVALATPVSADDIQSHESIQTTAESFIAEMVLSSHGRSPTATAGNLDPRLRLKDCSKPLEAFQPTGGRLLGNTTVGVRCTGAQPWTLYVPVKVSIHEMVVVAARPLSKGTIVRTQDVKLLKMDLAMLHSGYYTDLSQVIGMQVARTVSMGAAVTTPAVKPRIQVKRGQQVNLVATANGLKVQMSGEALTNGATGERIRVRNLSTKKVIEGIVQSATTVQIAL